MNFTKSIIKINDEIKTVLCLNYKPEAKKSAKSVDLNSIHHIHIIDRSGSMCSLLSSLVENIKATIRIMRDEDFVSILWFSGRGQYKTLIKGARKSESLYALLDELKREIGMTHFSEVLQECRVVIDDLKALCPNFSVTMFTDGCPQEADEPILEQVRLMKDSILAFHTVGYGNYYNKELLMKMSALSQYGTLVHSSKIEDYLQIFTGNYEVIKDMAATPIDIVAPNCDILYIASKTAKRERDKMQISTADKNKNQFFIVAKTSEVNFKIDDKPCTTEGIRGIIKEIPEASLKNFFYAYIQQLYYAGLKGDALDIAVKQLRNKYVADLILRSFTFDEIDQTQKVLNRFVYSVAERAKYENTCDVNYMPAKDAFCLVDLFTLLSNSSAKYVPSKNYKRIGLKTTDENNLFVADKEQEYAPFSGFTYNKDKLNMSILFRVKGKVTLDAKEAKKVGLPEEIPTGIFRNHTLIKDGNLNMEQITVTMLGVDYVKFFNNMCQRLKDTKLANAMIVKGTHDNNMTTITLDLTKLPITNQKYAEQGTADYILKLAKSELVLTMQQKIVNGLIKRIEAENENAVSKTLRTYTPEQIAVLEAHGLDKNLNYKGVDNKKADKEGADFYFAKTLEFAIKGFSSLPTAEILVEKGEAKTNSVYADLFKFINILKNDEKINFKSVAVKTHDKLVKILSEIKSDLSALRGALAGIKIAKTLTGANWFDGAISDGKGKYTYTKDDTTLVINVGEEKCYF